MALNVSSSPVAFLEVHHPLVSGPADERLLGSFSSMAVASLCYLAIIASLSYINSKNIKERRAFNVKGISVVHNFIMAVYSFYAAVGTTWVVYDNWRSMNYSLTQPLCDPEHKIMRNMDWWVYSFYLSKFYEFIDTILLILRAKPVFPPRQKQYILHVFHHLTTASIVWVAWRLPFSSGWLGPVTNSIVHTFMYSYYLFTDLGMPTKWGGIFITPIQIIQFILCLSLSLVEPLLSTTCNPEGGVWSGYFYIFSCYVVFLTLFVMLFKEKKAQRKKMAAQKKAKGSDAGKDLSKEGERPSKSKKAE